MNQKYYVQTCFEQLPKIPATIIYDCVNGFFSILNLETPGLTKTNSVVDYIRERKYPSDSRSKLREELESTLDTRIDYNSYLQKTHSLSEGTSHKEVHEFYKSIFVLPKSINKRLFPILKIERPAEFIHGEISVDSPEYKYSKNSFIRNIANKYASKINCDYISVGLDEMGFDWEDRPIQIKRKFSL